MPLQKINNALNHLGIRKPIYINEIKYKKKCSFIGIFDTLHVLYFIMVLKIVK